MSKQQPPIDREKSTLDPKYSTIKFADDDFDIDEMDTIRMRNPNLASSTPSPPMENMIGTDTVKITPFTSDTVKIMDSPIEISSTNTTKLHPNIPKLVRIDSFGFFPQERQKIVNAALSDAITSRERPQTSRPISTLTPEEVKLLKSASLADYILTSRTNRDTLVPSSIKLTNKLSSIRLRQSSQKGTVRITQDPDMYSTVKTTDISQNLLPPDEDFDENEQSSSSSSSSDDDTVELKDSDLPPIPDEELVQPPSEENNSIKTQTNENNSQVAPQELNHEPLLPLPSQYPWVIVYVPGPHPHPKDSVSVKFLKETLIQSLKQSSFEMGNHQFLSILSSFEKANEEQFVICPYWNYIIDIPCSESSLTLAFQTLFKSRKSWLSNQKKYISSALGAQQHSNWESFIRGQFPAVEKYFSDNTLVKTIHKKFIDTFTDVLTHTNKIIILSDSLGAHIAYDCLWYLERHALTQDLDYQIDWCTFGFTGFQSQLYPIKYGYPSSDVKLGKLSSWADFNMFGDPFSQCSKILSPMKEFSMFSSPFYSRKNGFITFCSYILHPSFILYFSSLFSS